MQVTKNAQRPLKSVETADRKPGYLVPWGYHSVTYNMFRCGGDTTRGSSGMNKEQENTS